MLVGQVWSASFGVGRKTVWADVIAVRADARRGTAWVLDEEGDVYGPLATGRLRQPRAQDHARLNRAWREYLERNAATPQAQVEAEIQAPARHEEALEAQGVAHPMDDPPADDDAVEVAAEAVGLVCVSCCDEGGDLLTWGTCGTSACRACVALYAGASLGGGRSSKPFEGLPCPCLCDDAMPWSTLAQATTPAVFEALLRRSVPCQVVADEQGGGETATLDGCLRVARRRLRDTVDGAATLRAPCCDRAFDGFDACFALGCECGRFFCAWCLAFESASTGEVHDHVRTCCDNPKEGDVYGDFDAWNTTHRKKLRRREIVRAHEGMLRSMAEAREEMTEACRAAVL